MAPNCLDGSVSADSSQLYCRDARLWDWHGKESVVETVKLEQRGRQVDAVTTRTLVCRPQTWPTQAMRTHAVAGKSFDATVSLARHRQTPGVGPRWDVNATSRAATRPHQLLDQVHLGASLPPITFCDKAQEALKGAWFNGAQGMEQGWAVGALSGLNGFSQAKAARGALFAGSAIGLGYAVAGMVKNWSAMSKAQEERGFIAAVDEWNLALFHHESPASLVDGLVRLRELAATGSHFSQDLFNQLFDVLSGPATGVSTWPRLEKFAVEPHNLPHIG